LVVLQGSIPKHQHLEGHWKKSRKPRESNLHYILILGPKKYHFRNNKSCQNHNKNIFLEYCKIISFQGHYFNGAITHTLDALVY